MREAVRTNVLLFIRHGERCDNSNDQAEYDRMTNYEDPPLTNLGVSQAHVCGKALVDQLKGYDSIVIESSPF